MNTTPFPVLTPPYASPSLLRHVAAMLYDSLLLSAVLLLAAALVVLPLGLGAGIHAEDIGHHWLFRLYLTSVIGAFFIGFWLYGGQTLGMRAWRLRVIRMDGQPVNKKDAVLRLIGALLSWSCGGFGFLWCLIDPEQLTWHDRLSQTRLILLPRAPSSSH